MALQPQRPAFLIIGEILRPHGIRGELKMRVMTSYPERIAKLERIFLSEDEAGTKAQPHALQSARLSHNYALLKLAGVDDRSAADHLRALYVLVELDAAVPLEAGEYYLYELIGVNVITVEGETLGILTEILETGANDVYIIESAVYGQVLIPAIDEVIIETDIAHRTLTVKLPEGLLPAKRADEQ
jgi:16S rRNA processing protein RimM